MKQRNDRITFVDFNVCVCVSDVCVPHSILEKGDQSVVFMFCFGTLPMK